MTTLNQIRDLIIRLRGNARVTYLDNGMIATVPPTNASLLLEAADALSSLPEQAVTEEMVEAACVEAGWLAVPFVAPRESGVPTESDMSEADAAEINHNSRTAMREILEAALSLVGEK